MFPKRKDLFVAWAKAMVEGATVDKPNYGKTQSGSPRRRSKSGMNPQRRRRWRRRRSNAKKKAEG